MNRVLTYVIPRIRKAIIALLIPQVPAMIAVIQRDYGTAAGAEAVAVATALGVYTVPNRVPATAAPAPVSVTKP